MGLITLGAVASMDAIINLFDGVYATMAIPTMLSALWLSPKVRMAAKDYFARLDAGAFYTANPVSSKAAVSED
jgi:alanine or glycine:cation symporter, AGCS family